LVPASVQALAQVLVRASAPVWAPVSGSVKA
jgi:hypothetical protein